MTQNDSHQAYHFLVLPGWQNSGAEHWQTLWEARYGYTRVLQADWDLPRMNEWVEALDAAVLVSHKPIVFVAHSLGCILVAAWAARSVQRETIRSKVKAAFLVAPGDIEASIPGAKPAMFLSWQPIYRMPLPMPAMVVASEDDAFCRISKAQSLARSWQAEFVNAGPAGHLNAASGLGDWPQGLSWLNGLLERSV